MRTLQFARSGGAGSPARSKSCYLRCGNHEIHYLEWGDESLPPVIAWHALARNARDFDYLATNLSTRYRLICPDTIGRGLSQWSAAPRRDYCMDAYVRLAAELLDALGLQRVRWIGTSMGGAIGMHGAATVLRNRISALVLNDIGPTLPKAAAERIVAYVGAPPAFDAMTGLEDWLRTTYRPFGRQRDEEWRVMAETSARRLPDGRFTLHYDPAIVRQLADWPEDFELWADYDTLRIPVLVLRGAESDVLPADVADDMTRRGPCARRIDYAGCGHAPALNTDDRVDAIERFLDSG